MQGRRLTCRVKGEEEEEQAGEQVPQEGDHSAGDAFRNRVHRLDEKLEEDWHAAVDEDAHQDAGSVQDGCKIKSRTTISCGLFVCCVTVSDPIRAALLSSRGGLRHHRQLPTVPCVQ